MLADTAGRTELLATPFNHAARVGGSRDRSRTAGAAIPIAAAATVVVAATADVVFGSCWLMEQRFG